MCGCVCVCVCGGGGGGWGLEIMDGILDSISNAIHRVKQRLFRNHSGSASCDLLRFLARKSKKKAKFFVQINFDKLPNMEEEEK